MSREYVDYIIEEGMAIVTVNHPPVNAINKKMVLELEQVVDTFDVREGMKAFLEK